METNLPSFFSFQILEKLLKFLVNFTLLKYAKSQKSYGFLITKELIFWLPNFGFKRSLLCLLDMQAFLCKCAHAPINKNLGKKFEDVFRLKITSK